MSQDLREAIEKYRNKRACDEYPQRYADDGEPIIEQDIYAEGFTAALDLLWPCVEAADELYISDHDVEDKVAVVPYKELLAVFAAFNELKAKVTND